MSYNLIGPYNRATSFPSQTSALTMFWFFPFNDQFSAKPLNHGVMPADCTMVSGFSWDNNAGSNRYGGLYCNGTAGCGLTINPVSSIYSTPTSACIPPGYVNVFMFKFNVVSFQGKSYFPLYENVSGNTGWRCAIDADGSMSVGIRNSASYKYGDNTFSVNGTFSAGNVYFLMLAFFTAEWGTNVPQCYMQLYQNGFFKKEAFQTWSSNDYAALSSGVPTIGNNVARSESNIASFYLHEIRMYRGRTSVWAEQTGMIEAGYW